MTKTVEVSVVVPTHNNESALANLIRALASQTLDPNRWDLTVVDDCSSDGSWDTLRSLAQNGPLPFRALQTPANTRGPAAPRNLGWRTSSGEVIAFLDDDCLPDAGWLEAGLDAMRADPTIGVVQGCTRVPSGIDLIGLDRSTVFRQILDRSPWFEATNIFYRRAALEQVDGFDESFTGPWCEDTDLGWRVVESGWSSGFSPDAIAVHAVERRDWRWWLHIGLMGANMVTVVTAHPELRRQAFWRPWAQRREDAAFVAALVGAAASLRWKPAAALALPYLWWRRPSLRARRFFGQSFEIVVADFARLAGHLRGSWKNRTLVL